jgi:hypothetical protein
MSTFVNLPFDQFEELIKVLGCFFKLVLLAIDPLTLIPNPGSVRKINWSGPTEPIDLTDFCRQGEEEGDINFTRLTDANWRWLHRELLPKCIIIEPSAHALAQFVKSLQKLNSGLSTIRQSNNSKLKPDHRKKLYNGIRTTVNNSINYLLNHLCGGTPEMNGILELLNSIPEFPKQVPKEGLYHPNLIAVEKHLKKCRQEQLEKYLEKNPEKHLEKNPEKHHKCENLPRRKRFGVSIGSSSCVGDDIGSSSCVGDDIGSSSCVGDDIGSSSCVGDDIGSSCVRYHVPKHRPNYDDEVYDMNPDAPTNSEAIILKGKRVTGPYGNVEQGVKFRFEDEEDMVYTLGKFMEYGCTPFADLPPNKSKKHVQLGAVYVPNWDKILFMTFYARHGENQRVEFRTNDPKITGRLTSRQTNLPDDLSFLNKPIGKSHPGKMRAIGPEAIQYQLNVQERLLLCLAEKHNDPQCQFDTMECWRPECKLYRLRTIYRKPDPHEYTIGACQGCHFRFCTKCHQPEHEGECDKPDEATEALIARISKPCPNPTCGTSIERNEGCNHMTCANCRTHFCWTCGEMYPLDEHRAPMITQHYVDNNAFGGCAAANAANANGDDDHGEDE